ncbi:TonB-dependent receptor [Shewanella baltica]|uniref:TonB-dependent receptor n=1 Tax=Shewanella baltica TaxID=62322 RepID=UPI003218A693
MNKNSFLAYSVRVALVGSIAASALTIPVASAAEDGVEKVERIQVTGSRIKRTDMETSSPVSVIDASAIIASGATSIDDVLQKMTSAGGAMTNAAINNGSGGNSRINLRGLGESRTLILVNGRRMIASGTGAASTVDLNTIPVSMIQRVEVLKDGASAVYGTDAIAGVVNIILKRDFDGLELNAQTGISARGDADETSLDFTLGNTFERGNIVVNAQYTKRGEASQADRGFSDCPIAESKVNGKLSLVCVGSSYSEGGHVWGDPNFQITPSGPDGEYQVGDSGYYGKYVTGPDGKPMFNYFDGKSEANLSGLGGTYHDYADAADGYNYAKDSYLSTPMERINLSLAGTYEINDSLRFFTEAMYSKRWSEQQMAPQPVWNNSPWEYKPKSSGGWMTDDLLPYVQPGEGVSYGRRVVESGTRDFSQTVDTLRIVVGFEGELENGWSWDASYNKGRNDSVDTTANLHNLGSINEAVISGDFDPFLQSSWMGENIKPYIYTELNSGGSELDILAATLTGDIMDLPAGTLGFAAGYENRKESAHFTPDSLTAQGLANDPPVEPTDGEFSVNELYVELAIPLLSELPLAQQVDLSAAMRYFNYDTFGEDTTWKLGLTWQVYDDLMLRGNLSTAFRAPTVSELFGGKQPSFEQITHPASSQTQAEVTVGGNPLLTPEEADIKTVGFVYSPSYVDGLSLTVDYYDIAITNTITSVDPGYVADNCLGANGGLINTGSALCQSSHIQMDNTGRIKFDNGLQNLGETNTSGFDINVAYVFSALGLDWKAGLDSSILSDYVEYDPDGNPVDYRGFITAKSGAYAKFKSNFSLTASANDWSVTYEVRYIDGMDSFSCRKDATKCYAPSVDSIVYNDISASYDLTKSLRVSGGVNNIFDKDPLYFTGNNDANTDPYTYDVLGRYFFVRANLKF